MTDPSPNTDMTSILEGAEKAIVSVSQYLKTVGIESTVTLAEDCQPDA